MPGPAPSAIVDHFFRHESGRLTATLTRVLGAHRLDVIEDIVQQCLVEALERWSLHDVPHNPAAWLTAVARRRAIDRLRREGTRRRLQDDVEHALSPVRQVEDRRFGEEVADDTLRMMFTCCVPSLTVPTRVALILKMLCGFSVREIAAAMMATPQSVERRLSRAKQRVREHGLVDLPSPALLEQADGVLASIYALFSEGFHGSYTERVVRAELCGEALRLARLLADHPRTASPQSDALVALICLHTARLPARIVPDGGQVPGTRGACALITLRYQDRSRWDPGLMREGLERLGASARGTQITRLHLEAGLAATHAIAPSWEGTDWTEMVHIYEALLDLAPTPIVALNHAIAVGWRDGADTGLAALDALNADDLPTYPFVAAARAELWARKGDVARAVASFDVAIAQSRNQDERHFFETRRAAVQAP